MKNENYVYLPNMQNFRILALLACIPQKKTHFFTDTLISRTDDHFAKTSINLKWKIRKSKFLGLTNLNHLATQDVMLKHAN